MIDDIDIKRSAQVLVKHHGETAPIHAALRAGAMAKAGDVEGYEAWKRILRAVDELLSKGMPAAVKRPSGASSNQQQFSEEP